MLISVVVLSSLFASYVMSGIETLDLSVVTLVSLAYKKLNEHYSAEDLSIITLGHIFNLFNKISIFIYLNHHHPHSLLIPLNSQVREEKKRGEKMEREGEGRMGFSQYFISF